MKTRGRDIKGKGRIRSLITSYSWSDPRRDPLRTLGGQCPRTQVTAVAGAIPSLGPRALGLLHEIAQKA